MYVGVFRHSAIPLWIDAHTNVINGFQYRYHFIHEEWKYTRAACLLSSETRQIFVYPIPAKHKSNILPRLIVSDANVWSNSLYVVRFFRIIRSVIEQRSLKPGQFVKIDNWDFCTRNKQQIFQFFFCQWRDKNTGRIRYGRFPNDRRINSHVPFPWDSMICLCINGVGSNRSKTDTIDAKLNICVHISLVFVLCRSDVYETSSHRNQARVEIVKGLNFWYKTETHFMPNIWFGVLFLTVHIFWSYMNIGHIVVRVRSSNMSKSIYQQQQKKKKTKLLPCLMVITSISRLYPMEKNTGPTMWTSNSQQHILPRWPIATSTSTSIVFHSKGTLIA